MIYNGHIDVLPVGNPSDWRFEDPFSGKTEDGKLYGRGACDMKGGLVAQLKGIEAILRSGVKLKGDIILESVVGEETMSHEVGVTAVCDAAFLNMAGILTVIYGPGSLLQAHAVDEYVCIEELNTATKTFALAAMDWCGYE